MEVRRYAPLVAAVLITGLITLMGLRSSQRIGNTSLAIWELQKILIFALATLIGTRIIRLVLGRLRSARGPVVSPIMNAWITFAVAAVYFMGVQLVRRPTYLGVVEVAALLPLRHSSGLMARIVNAFMLLPGLLLWLNVDLLRAEKLMGNRGTGATTGLPPE